MTDDNFVPETSDDRNSAQTKQTTFHCGHENCDETFDSPEELGRHTAQHDNAEIDEGK